MAEITVATWNIFLNKSFPQPDRINAITDKLVDFDTQQNLSALALQEVMAIDDIHHGDIIKAKLGMDGLFEPHSRKKLGEHIGLVGNNLADIGTKDLGYNKVAIKAYLGDIALVSLHLRKQTGKQFPRGLEQVEQSEKLLEWVADDDKVIMMGDFNCLPFHRPRKMFETEGFHHAFGDTHTRRRYTVPTSDFLNTLSVSDQRAVKLFGRWLNVDDIYLRNLTAVDGGYDEGSSDHRMVWAKISSL